MKSIKTRTLCFLLPCLLIATTPASGRVLSLKSSRTLQLKVALFPYIPDTLNDNHTAMVDRIEREFEAQNPSIDLVLKRLDKNDDFYDSETLIKWLTTAPTGGGYHIVEVDTVLLGELVAAGSIAPWNGPQGMADWHPAGRQAVNVNRKIYGIPHWLCGHFIFSRDRRVNRAKSVNELLYALDKANPAIPNLTGNLLGSWNLPALYLDAWADTHGPHGIASAMSPKLDIDVMRTFKLFSKQCETSGNNRCIDGVFDEKEDLAAQEFALVKSDAFLGYSERLSYLLQNGVKAKDLMLSSAPLGRGKKPVLFVDAFVLRSDCDSNCQKASARFAEYMNAAKTQGWVLMSRDKNTVSIPRYLLPATLSAFKAPGVRSDSHFAKLKREITTGVPYPSTGLPDVRKKMRDVILAELKK